MIVAIGTPGHEVRMFVRDASPTDALAQCAPAEVAIEYAGEGPLPRLCIAADGVSLVPYVAPLDEARATRWTEARTYRDARQTATCPTPKGVVDIDPDSQRKINGAATAAMAAALTGAPFDAIGWTMADNSVVPHDAGEIIAMGLAVVACIDACQQAGTTIRGQIEAAETIEALAAIDITAGYPASGDAA